MIVLDESAWQTMELLGEPPISITLTAYTLSRVLASLALVSYVWNFAWQINWHIDWEMISAISWVPKGAAKTVPELAEPPLQDGIGEMLKNRIMERKYIQTLLLHAICRVFNK